MTKADIMRWAQEAGLKPDGNDWGANVYRKAIEDFANLVAAAQREADAKLIEEYPYWIGTNAQREIAAAIRMRGDK